MQIGLASKRTWCKTEVAEKFTCPAACVERVWVPTDACPSCSQEPGGQAAISSYSPLILMWLFTVMGTEPRGLHMLNNFYHRDSSQPSNFHFKETFFSWQFHMFFFFKKLLFPTFSFRPLICLWSAYFDRWPDRMSYWLTIIRVCVIEPVCQCLELLYRTEVGILRIFTTTWNNLGGLGKMDIGTVPKHHAWQVGWSSGNKFNTLKYTPFFLSSWAH